MSENFKRSLQWKVSVVAAAVVGSWPTFLTFADKYIKLKK